MPKKPKTDWGVVEQTPHWRAFQKWARLLAMKPYSPPPAELMPKMLTHDEKTGRIVPMFPEAARKVQPLPLRSLKTQAAR
jgi:hypothetical protein